MDISRRTGLGLAAGLLAPAIAAPAFAKAQPLDLSQTRDMFTAYARMRGLTPQKLGLWWYAGTVFAERKDEVQEPILGVEGFSFNRLQVLPDGNLSQVITEAGYFKDINTGAVLTDWTNPLNGQVCQPKHYRLIQKIKATATTISIEDNSMQPASTAGKIGPAIVSGDMVWIAENFSNKYLITKRDGMDAAMYPGPVVVGTSLATFSAKLSDVQNLSQEFVPALLAYQSMSGFLPWMRMGREPGLVNWQLMGRKLKSMAELPDSLRVRYEKDHPGWLANPGI